MYTCCLYFYSMKKYSTQWYKDGITYKMSRKFSILIVSILFGELFLCYETWWGMKFWEGRYEEEEDEEFKEDYKKRMVYYKTWLKRKALAWMIPLIIFSLF